MKKTFKKLISFSISFVIIFIIASQNINAAQVGDPINVIFSKDPNMAQAIADVLGRNVNDPLTPLDAQTNYLEINNKGISNLEGISIFKDLKTLYADKNTIEKIPAEIGELTKLEDLSIRDSQLKEVPTEIGNLSSIVQIDLEGNSLTSLPESLGKLSKLEHLLLGVNNLESLPDSVGQLSSISNFNLYDNKLTTFPTTLAENKSLGLLDARKNKITHLPDNFGDISNLTTVMLGGNMIEELPESITKLEKLDMFFIESNKLVRLPDSFGDLTKLELLDLSFNQLTSLPSSINKLSSLNDLELTNNFLPNDVVSKLNTILPSTTITHTGTKKLVLNDTNQEYNISSENDINSIILEDKVSYDSSKSISNKHKLILDDYKDVADATVDLSDYIKDGDVIKDGIITAKIRATGTGVFPNNSENAITDDTIKLIFIKKDKTGFVEVNYVDKDNKKIIEPDLLSGIVGTSFEIESKDIKGYELIDIKGATTGSYTDKKQSVTFIYKKISASDPLPAEDEGEDDTLPSAGLNNTTAIIFLCLSTVLLGGYKFIKKYN